MKYAPTRVRVKMCHVITALPLYFAHRYFARGSKGYVAVLARSHAIYSLFSGWCWFTWRSEGATYRSLSPQSFR